MATNALEQNATWPFSQTGAEALQHGGPENPSSGNQLILRVTVFMFSTIFTAHRGQADLASASRSTTLDLAWGTRLCGIATPIVKGMYSGIHGTEIEADIFIGVV